MKPELSPTLVFCETLPNAYEIICCDLLMKCEAARVLVLYKAPCCPAKMAEQMFKA